MQDIPLIPVKERIEFSHCNDGVINTTLDQCDMTFDDFSAEFKEPDIGTKDGSYFIRGEAPERKDEFLNKADLIIIDADSSIDLKTDQVSDGAPDAKLIHDFLKNYEIAHVLYSSYSNVDKGNRYRVVIPAELNDKDDLKRCIDFIFFKIHDAGIGLNNSTENSTWAQAWYLPRVTEKNKDHYEYYHFNSGQTIDPTEINTQTEASSNTPVPSSEKALPSSTAKNQYSETQLAELAELIDEINADEYQVWIKVGMAIHYETKGSENGFDLWNQWSKTSEKYNDVEECHYKWKSFNKSSTSNPITIGTIIFFANKSKIKNGNASLSGLLEYSQNTGKLIKSLTNARNILLYDPQLDEIRHNEFKRCDMVGSKTISDTGTLMYKLYIAEEYDCEFPTTKIREAIVLAAHTNTYHPLQDYLRSITWDKQPRIESFFIDYADAEDSLYTRAVTLKMFISAVSRAFDPGCKVDSMLVLEGPQGCRKSTLVRTLSPTPEWFSDSELQIGYKDAYQLLHGIWLYEIGEMNSIIKANGDAMKGYLSASTDKYRPPYGNKPIEATRSNIFIGTTNDDDYLKDPTGARRFWPMKVNNIDTDAIKANRDQLWAEAVYRYFDGETCYLDSDQEKLARKEQDKRYQQDTWEDEIRIWLDDNQVTKTTSTIICRELFNISVSHIDRKTQHRVAEIMKRLEWVRGTVRVGGKSHSGYKKGNP